MTRRALPKRRRQMIPKGGNTFHISYAAFPNDGKGTDYIRARRYLPEKNGLRGTVLTPDYYQTGLFATAQRHHISVAPQSDAHHAKAEPWPGQLRSWS